MSGDGARLDGTSDAELERTLASLKIMKLDQLRDAWRRLLHLEPPLRSATVLRAELGWALQARVFGDLDAKTRKQLAVLARSISASRTKGEQPVPLAPGTTLVREWRGRELHIDVVEDGFVFKGQHFKSLSAVARQIAGSRWSGPRFFGLIENPPAKKAKR